MLKSVSGSAAVTITPGPFPGVPSVAMTPRPRSMSASVVSERTLMPPEPAGRRSASRAADGNRLQVLKRRREDGHPDNGAVSPGSWGHDGIVPEVPRAVIVSFAPMYASVFTVSTTVETAAPRCYCRPGRAGRRAW